MKLNIVSAFVLFLMFSACGGSAQNAVTPPPTPGTSFVLTWSDEFSGSNGSAPDSSKWVLETGGGGWGNNELETYTSRPENAKIEDGNLVITALKEDFTGTDGILRHYTSARLKSAGRFEQKFGRFEARIKIPQGQGIWPAFWMLGNNIGTVQWPACGEIDIMENIGKEPSTVHGSLHGTGYDTSAPFSLSTGKFADDFHIYAVEWEQGVIRFYVDGTLYDTRKAADITAGQTWPFDHPFFLLLNVAVGGNWPGSPDGTSVYPQTMLIDYVRVYSRQ